LFNLVGFQVFFNGPVRLAPAASASFRSHQPASIEGPSWCPLKITPTGRPDSRAFLVKSEKTEAEQQSKKKDHENQTTKQTRKQKQ
jgi:hypothetical protein